MKRRRIERDADQADRPEIRVDIPDETPSLEEIMARAAGEGT